ncbi:50S ribosomal protein L17 [Candidatus Roizmanbacteria bacterium RIFCSPHIGHO2_02_FULL_37_15]|uniref:50S ribosomal protein L17 n=1 Tax=Candidatus Roizmanbacteria bacterium RIFCSPLOWO2_01_FULL_37_16 TaxID=1802058 RepID=A0A1F7IQX0_9BACT|nr:MAG: 50S ribosomal protein L17 [Candidatus Roizmanbacteria bacterium RIFCSPHIGHO2_01_FULL_37_16b]OGK20753.1 MAG: 50S ribosomal protein L17 [Candidatus Roizmanbacteria bacterium RIFCSPHIGHO2_02_FULL_37_15]OGK33039.1 MAG: 50S ribosomal protein L17 [Candidatus Roizmanbacteria bacterium RIFCSPHIGHO2_12_FULL_36_11]OGK45746.1 MAG: 50S ribosomal protein L17 [Candidatus Roizmanbacteria bacterium RIFCSPLOWO2_01_FULL_37_16]OGK56079.1 MAG: 50S ribosomal protein L17 [Candidatus Roizmanbacteria bacterium
MRHRVKKIKFKLGKDANKMLLRKLAINFISNAKIKTTIKKAKVLKSVIDKLVEKAKTENEANKNYLLHFLGEEELVRKTFKLVGDSLKNRDHAGGYVRIRRLGKRQSDGSEMARLEWVYPVVKSDKSEESKNQIDQKSEKSEIRKSR